jgi:hypothetical protein
VDDRGIQQTLSLLLELTERYMLRYHLVRGCANRSVDVTLVVNLYSTSFTRGVVCICAIPVHYAVVLRNLSM